VDHSGFTDQSGTTDCAACHAWPGTGTPTPNWLGASGGGAPSTITVGGFKIPQPPATSAQTQAGIPNLPHPGIPTGGSCTSCHQSAAGGKKAKGYDHASSLITPHCNACHEAGSDLVGTPWNGATTSTSGAGDARPFTLTSIRATYKGDSATERAPNHFFKVDCGECHRVPSGLGSTTTGTAYLDPGRGGAWYFPHDRNKMTSPSTCVLCHTNGIPD
jgi:hypothetical protein